MATFNEYNYSLPDNFPIVKFGLFTSFYYFRNKMNSCMHKSLSGSLTIFLRKIPRNGNSRSTDVNTLKILDAYCQIALRIDTYLQLCQCLSGPISQCRDLHEYPAGI